MPKNIRKYCLRIFSLIMLISFLFSNVSICQIIISDCESEKRSCCCKEFSDKNSAPLKIEKSCCCEIKEATNQPAEITLAFSEGKQKISTYVLNTYTNNRFDIFENNKFKVRALSIHSPPGEKIYILISNFRI